MNGELDVRSETSSGTKNKSTDGSTKKGSKKRSKSKSSSFKNKQISSEDKKPPENEPSPQNPEEANKGKFEGDFFKDFYYAQGDYKAEEAEEVEELKHAKDVSKQLKCKNKDKKKIQTAFIDKKPTRQKMTKVYTETKISS